MKSLIIGIILLVSVFLIGSNTTTQVVCKSYNSNNFIGRSDIASEMAEDIKNYSVKGYRLKNMSICESKNGSQGIIYMEK